MSTAKSGDVVHVHFSGRFRDGTVFGTSRDQGPLAFTLGEGEVIPGVEDAVLGLSVGDKVTVEVPPERGYGVRRDDLVLSLAPDQFPEERPPSVGDRFDLTGDGGRPVRVTVTEVGDETVEVDANHPLAGKELTFDLELARIA